MFDNFFPYAHHKRVSVICHPEGDGTRMCLFNLVQDLVNHGFATQVYSEPDDGSLYMAQNRELFLNKSTE